MANLCCGEMRVRGTKENREKFLSFFQKPKEKSLNVSFRRFEIDIFEPDYNTNCDYISFQCSWSVSSNMFFPSVSMLPDHENKKVLYMFPEDEFATIICDLNYDSLKNIDKENIELNLAVACKVCDVEVEIISEEEGCNFSEHIYVNNEGEIVLEETEELFSDEFFDSVSDLSDDEYSEKWNEEYDRVCERIYSSFKYITWEEIKHE